MLLPNTIDRLLTRLAICLALVLAPGALGAAMPVPAPPTVAAEGHLLMDYDSGAVLTSHNAEARLEPASLTKIMTAYIVMRELGEGNIKLDEEVPVSNKAWRTPGSRMFIEVGKRVPLVDLLKGMIIQSGNDASVALAEHIAGSEETFANLMNEHAARLGMKNTHFVNSTGLPDDDHYTTAADIALVTIATIREFPEYYKWYAEKEFTFNDIQQHNRNRLLWRDDSVDGVKTGHTEAAGYCLVAAAQRDNMRLISVVMGTESEEARAKESLSLLNYGFRFFETHRLYGPGEPLASPRVWKGDRENVGAGLAEPLFVTIPRRQYDNLQASLSLEQRIMAPVREGDVLGRILVTLDGELVAEEPLQALASVDEGGIWSLVKDSALLWLE